MNLNQSKVEYNSASLGSSLNQGHSRNGSASSKTPKGEEPQNQESLGCSKIPSNQDGQKFSFISSNNPCLFEFCRRNDLDTQLKTQALATILQKLEDVPEGMKKSLLILQYLSKAQQPPSLSNYFYSFDLQKHQVILNKLKEELEKLDPLNMSTLIANCETHFANEDWKDAFDSVTQLLHKFRFSNLQEILKLVQADPNANNIMEEQLRHCQYRIHKAFQNSHFEKVKSKLRKLNSLKELIKDEMIKKWYLSCRENINTEILKAFDEECSRINICMEEKNYLFEHEIKKFKDKVLEFQTLTDLTKGESIQSEGNDLDSLVLQNLEKQIENLLESLKTKNIDDPILKSTFDKLQLISESFPKCPQFLESCEKTNNIILSLLDKACENYSILLHSKKFQDSEAELTKIKQFSILSTEDSARKYRRLKDYSTIKYQKLKDQLLDIVKSSVPKLIESVLKNYILTQEDIGTIHLEISRLESIKDIFAQRNHISQEEVESVSKSCAHKIQLYFERLIRKTDEQMDISSYECLPKVQESFAQLHQLHLGINTQLFDKQTTDSYSNLIEKLRRKVQDIPIKIAKNLDKENKKINSLEVAEILSLLARIQWIDKFETNLHSKVLDGIRDEALKFYDHLMYSLKKILISRREAFGWIQDASKIIVTVGEMSCLENTSLELEKKGLEVLKLFEENMNSDIKTLKQLFEKFHQQTDKFSEFEFEESLERPLYDSKTYEDISKVTIKHFQLQENLEDLLRKYRDYLSKTFAKYFNSINEYKESLISENFEELDLNNQNLQDDTSASSMNTNIEKRISKVSEDIEAILGWLRFVHDIQTKYPCFYKKLESQQKFMTKLKNMLIQLFTDIKDGRNTPQFQFNNEIKYLRKMIELVQLLRPLNEFFPDQSSKISTDYHKQISEKVNKTKESIIQALRDCEFQKIKLHMADFMAGADKQSRDEIQMNLDQLVENLLRETRLAVNTLRISESVAWATFDSIIKALGKIRGVSACLGSYLRSQTPKSLENFELEMEATLGKKLKSKLELIEHYVSESDFKVANDQKEILNDIIEVLGEFCEKDILIKFDGLDILEKNKLEELKEMYSKLKVSQYPGNNSPKKVFLELEKCLERKPDYYGGFLRAMKQNILQAFEKELQEPSIEKLKYAKYYLENYLPESLVDHVKKIVFDFKV